MAVRTSSSCPLCPSTMDMNILGMDGCFPAAQATYFSEFISLSVAMNFLLKFYLDQMQFLNI